MWPLLALAACADPWVGAWHIHSPEPVTYVEPSAGIQTCTPDPGLISEVLTVARDEERYFLMQDGQALIEGEANDEALVLQAEWWEETTDYEVYGFHRHFHTMVELRHDGRGQQSYLLEYGIIAEALVYRCEWFTDLEVQWLGR
ncbi:MAG: hypothetical protein EP330_08310 [Deltaproteobacteria bacterium]|nr:MAG: hypothetical protein EP330_08310 [Deltaproteobacteria bacterium]